MSRYNASYQTEKYTVRLRIHDYKEGVGRLDELLGLRHELAYEKGQKIKKTAIPASRSYWAYKLDDFSDETPEGQVLRLLEKILPNKDLVFAISKDCKIQISITTTTYDYNPEYIFSEYILKTISDLGAELWIDTYVLVETYLEEDDQQTTFVTRLQKSKSAKRLGIVTSEEAQALAQVLHLYEMNKDVIYDDLFPDYAGGEPATEEDTNNSLLLAREKLVELHDAIEKSDFLMSKAKDNPIK